MGFPNTLLAKLTQRQPDCTAGWYHYGTVLANLGQHDKALEALQRATGLPFAQKSHEANAWRHLASLYSIQKNEYGVQRALNALQRLNATMDEAFLDRFKRQFPKLVIPDEIRGKPETE